MFFGRVIKFLRDIDAIEERAFEFVPPDIRNENLVRDIEKAQANWKDYKLRKTKTSPESSA